MYIVSDFDIFIQNSIQDKRKKYLDDIAWSAPKLFSSGYPNGWANERTKSDWQVKNKLALDENYFKKPVSTNEEANDYFSEDTDGSFNTNSMYDESIIDMMAFTNLRLA